jgi:hypothetical protein
MKKYQNFLLSSVAALALVAGVGIASAQQSNEHMGGAKAATPPAGQSMNRSGAMQPQAQEKGKGTQTQAAEKSKATQTQAQEKGKTEAGRTAQTGNKENANPAGNMGKRGASSNARAERTNHSKTSRQNTAERQRTLKGLHSDTTKPMQGQNQQGEGKANTSNQAQQSPANETRGNSANQGGKEGAQANGGARVQGANVQLSEQQRTQIKQTVIDSRSAPRVSHVDFDVRIGTVVPRGSIHFVPVPETLVRIEPRWRGYEYFVYEDEVVIIDPSDMKIVVIINV